jgi:dolichol phosphate-mannose biosynthesis regulatory protein
MSLAAHPTRRHVNAHHRHNSLPVLYDLDVINGTVSPLPSTYHHLLFLHLSYLPSPILHSSSSSSFPPPCQVPSHLVSPSSSRLTPSSSPLPPQSHTPHPLTHPSTPQPNSLTKFQPFVDTTHPLQSLFPPRVWAIRIPVILTLLASTIVGSFLGLVMVRSNRKKAAKARAAAAKKAK